MRRETFIALRARRLGHQIASLFLNPPLDVPEFQKRTVPADELRKTPSVFNFDVELPKEDRDFDELVAELEATQRAGQQYAIRDTSPRERAVLRAVAVVLLVTIFGTLACVLTDVVRALASRLWPE